MDENWYAQTKLYGAKKTFFTRISGQEDLKTDKKTQQGRGVVFRSGTLLLLEIQHHPERMLR